MAEIPGPSENLGKSPVGDKRHNGLLAGFLFAGKKEEADSAWDRLRVDNNRRSLGMTEQERGTAEVLDWAKENAPGIAREGAMIVGPAVLTAAVWETVPQSHRAVEMAVVSGLGVGTLMTLGGEVVRRIAELYPRFSKFAEGAAVVRSVGLVFTQISASAGIGMVGAELANRLREAFNLSAAAQMGQPDAALYGYQANPPAGISETAWQARRDAIQGLTSGQPAEVVVPHLPQVPVDSGEAQLAAQEAAQRAKQTVELQAATPVGLTGQELAGGMIWGNEMDFVRQQGVYHVEPATNLLKGFAKLIAQPQPPTEIGPSDTAYMVNRDVAGWAVKQLDTLYRMEPSAMNSWQKALWEISRGLRGANWQDLQAVTEEFVKQAQP